MSSLTTFCLANSKENQDGCLFFIDLFGPTTPEVHLSVHGGAEPRSMAGFQG